MSDEFTKDHADGTPDDDPGEETDSRGDTTGGSGDAGSHRGRRLTLARVVTALAAVLVIFALTAPNELGRLTPAALMRIPIEALLGVALVLVLPAAARRVVGAIAGAVLGLLLVLKIVDMGFFLVLARPFDPVFDWTFFGAGVDFLTESVGRAGAIATVVGAAVLVVAVLVLMTLSVLRLTRVVAGSRSTAARAVSVLGVAWVACALLGTQIVPGVPVAADAAATGVYDRVLQVRAGLRDQEAFAAEASIDAFRDTPGEQLLTALRGKDVIISFVESYGRVAVEDPELAPQVDAVLDAGTRRLRDAGFASRSAFLTSPTAGGGSWLAHATLLSGVQVDNQQRYTDLVRSDRLTLNGTFRRAGWRTVLVMPALTQVWPEGKFFASDQIYGSQDLGYQGPKFSFAPMPDQYTLSAFQRLERATPDRPPLMAEIPLVSSHAPWTPTPQLVDWDEVGDGSVFKPMVSADDSADDVWRDTGRVRAEYRRSIEYSLNTLVSYLETYGDDELVLVFLGDHQPAPVVTGEDASRDVPITIVARDPAVLDRIARWGWEDGLNPGPGAPVWPMDAFRDRFLKAF